MTPLWREMLALSEGQILCAPEDARVMQRAFRALDSLRLRAHPAVPRGVLLLATPQRGEGATPTALLTTTEYLLR